MKKEEIENLFNSYEEAVCKIEETECWSARDLQKLFGYSLWQNFCKVIEKAKEACRNVGQQVSDHFIDVNKMVVLVPVFGCLLRKNLRLLPFPGFFL